MFISAFCSRVRERARRTYAVLAVTLGALAGTVALLTLQGPAALAAPPHNVIPGGGDATPATVVVPTVVHVSNGFATWQVAWIAAGAAILAAVTAVRIDRSRARYLAETL
jgi:hypothetical protein